MDIYKDRHSSNSDLLLCRDLYCEKGYGSEALLESGDRWNTHASNGPSAYGCRFLSSFHFFKKKTCWDLSLGQFQH